MSKEPSKRDLTALVTACKEIARQGGAILKQGFSRRLTITYKGRIDPVTDVDLKTEKFVVGEIRRRFPTHDVLAEEGSNSALSSPYCWVIDPLDGTVNFSHGFPVYCISIAVQYRGNSIAGAVYDPERDELFWAAKGQGAWLNKTRIHVTNEKLLERSLLATGFAYDIGSSRKNNLGLFARMAKKAQGIRRPGSAAIDVCWLACGRLDGFWELKLAPWDTAASILILAEAGGKLSRVDGSPHNIFAPDLVASNGQIHRQMLAVLAGKKSTRSR